MKKSIVMLSLSISLAVSPILAQDASTKGGAPPFAVSVVPHFSIPLGENAEFADYGGGASLLWQYIAPSQLAGMFGASLAYNYTPTDAFGNISILSAGLNAGLLYGMLPWLGFSVSLSGGYYGAADLSTLKASAYFYAAADAGLFFRIAPWLRLGIGAEYVWNFYFGGSLRPYVGTKVGAAGYSVPRAVKREPQTPATRPDVQPLSRPEEARPLSETGLKIESVSLAKIYPVFFSRYNTNSVGSVTVNNPSETSITDVRVALFVNSYMDVPKYSEIIPVLNAGESASLDLYALFNDSILQVTEGKQVAVTLTVEYQSDGSAKSQSINETLEILYRNALTWDDDRRAAVFVTAKDPAILSFARNVKSMVENTGSSVIDKNMRLAIAIHEALSLHGITYTSDPQNPFSERRESTDFLQFPRETLEYRGGDCDDLTTLYCALFEALSIETAFITIPGHIYMAIGLTMSENDARAWYSRPDELILMDGKAWVPIEVTDREGGFQQAWLTGAKEWRENYARGQTGFFPVREAWRAYSPVQLPGTSIAIALPAADSIVSSFEHELNWFLNREIAPKVAQLESQIRNSGGSTRYVNKLGVLYARYGIYDKAEEQFKKLLAQQEYEPALINMGHVARLRGDSTTALDYFDRVLRSNPDNTKGLLASAQLHHELENYGMVAAHYRKLVELDPALAQRFAYLDLRGEEANRAADANQAKGVTVWDEE